MVPSTHLLRLRRKLTVFVLFLVLAGVPSLVTATVISFSDVPMSSPYYYDVEAIAQAGVTTGCGGGKYCPKDYVTREQMAAFLNRLGALANNKTPVVNAAKLSGKTDSAFHQYGTTAPGLTTQYGAFAVEGQAAGVGAFGAAQVSFPVPINASLTPIVVKVGEATPTHCSGSVTAPGADAGYLCIFAGYALNISTTAPSYAVYNPATGSTGASHYGASIQVKSNAAGSYVLSGTWAATAPLIFVPFTPSGGPTMGK